MINVNVNLITRTILLIMESDLQGRFPLAVDHLQGTRAYGCDILSFTSNESRELFMENGDVNLIERFIEVKGSMNERGTISLKGNELLSAQQNRNRVNVNDKYICVR
jgi:hypothetical protein